MSEFIARFRERFGEIWGRMELRQKVILGILLLLSVSTLLFLTFWSTRSEMVVLFNKLSDEDAAKVQEKLDEQGVEYEIRETNGYTIMVPSGNIEKLRLQIHQDTDISTGGLNVRGYEIFDETNLGKTEKAWDIDYQRALEGELQRTISTIIGIEYVRVHLVIPEERLFETDREEPTASVLLHARDPLAKRQIDGISNLISAAVEGLEVRNVSITDNEGNELTDRYDDSPYGESSRQMKMKNRLEGVYRNKILYMLDKILEPGNSVVSVTADLDFDKSESTYERYDPESRVIRSEEVEATTTEELADSVNASTEHSITNYEIDKTIQHVTKEIGGVSRLSVSVSVNHKLLLSEENGDIVKNYEPRAQEEIAQIDSLVKNAVGYTPARGDRVFVNNMLFDRTQQELYEAQRRKDEQREQLISMIEKGAVLLLLLILMFMLIAQFRRIFAPAPEDEEGIRPALAEGEMEREGFYPEGEEGMPMGEGKISYTFKPMKDIEIEQTEDQIMQEAVRKFVIENPEVAIKLVKSWLMERTSPASRS